MLRIGNSEDNDMNVRSRTSSEALDIQINPCQEETSIDGAANAQTPVQIPENSTDESNTRQGNSDQPQTETPKPSRNIHSIESDNRIRMVNLRRHLNLIFRALLIGVIVTIIAILIRSHLKSLYGMKYLP